MITWNNEMQDISGKTAAAVQGACLSTDDKPLDVGNGSILVEMDTSKIYFFDAKNKTWREWS